MLNNFKEKKLVVLLGKNILNTSEIDELNTLMAEYLDWSQVLGYIHINKVFGIAWDTLKKYHLCNPKNVCSYKKFISLVEDMNLLQKLKLKDQLDNTLKVTRKLEENNIEYAVIKGISLFDYAYRDFSVRDFNDNDILVHSKNLKEIVQLMEGMGYIQGGRDYITETVMKTSRQEIMKRTLISHEIYPLVKKLENSLLGYHKLDFQFSIDLFSTNKTEEQNEKLFKNKTKIVNANGDCYYTLSLEDSLLFTCVHMFKEAIYDHKIKQYKDLALYKMCDINLFIHHNRENISWEKLIDRIHNLNLEKEIYYALFYTEEVFQTGLGEILSQIKPDNCDYLDYYYFSKNMKKFIWKDEIIDRIFDYSRAFKVAKISD